MNVNFCGFSKRIVAYLKKRGGSDKIPNDESSLLARKKKSATFVILRKLLYVANQQETPTPEERRLWEIRRVYFMFFFMWPEIKSFKFRLWKNREASISTLFFARVIF